MIKILRDLFGPSRKHIWAQFAREINAHYDNEGSWAKSGKVLAQHKEWVITLDKYTVSTGKSSVKYTRIRVPYINKDGFRFTIYRESFFSPVGRYFGMQDVEVGHDELDDAFVIKGNDEYKLWKLFKNDRIRDLLHAQPQIHLSIVAPADNGWFNKRFDDNVDELQFKVRGIIKDINRLKSLYDLFAEILDQLCLINAAYEDSPYIKRL